MLLNHKVIGEGFPVIVLHGLFGMLDNWQTIGKMLAEDGFMAVLVDQRDHGKSPRTTAFNYDILAQDLLHFMEDNWIYKAHLLGHSMGGKVALKFAFEHEDRLEKLIVVDVMNKAYRGGHEMVLKAIHELDAHAVANREEIYLHLRSYELDEGTVQFLLKNLSRRKEGGYDWKFNFDLLQANYQEILKPIASHDEECGVSTLFIRGEKSNYITEEDYGQIAKQFPNAEITTIADAGHWVHADKPEPFYHVVKNFLKKDI